MVFLFFFNDTATTEIYTLSLHDALPISWAQTTMAECEVGVKQARVAVEFAEGMGRLLAPLL